MNASRLASLTVACMLGALCGCATSLDPLFDLDSHVLARTPASGPIEGRPTYDLAWALPGQQTLLVPFALQAERFFLLDQDVFTVGGAAGASGEGSSGGSDSFAWSDSVRWHNAIFHDVATGEEWALLDRRGVISRIWIFGRRAEGGRPESEALVFSATVDDTNGDGKLDALDASVAIVTEGDGRAPRRATPADGQLLAVGFLPDQGALQLRVLADTDGGGFGSRDLALTYWLGLDEGGAAVPLLGEETKRGVEALLR